MNKKLWYLKKLNQLNKILLLPSFSNILNTIEISEILSTLRNMNMLEQTDNLHEIFGFRTDYEINTYKDF